MSEKEFNLIDEPWIRVLDEHCEIKQVSLMDVILNAHEYIDFSGELATQDIAILRLILAVLHTVFSRVNLEGEDFPLEEEEDAYERWKELWDEKKFPEKPIREYLEQWKERFWLFHPERPFGQVAGMDYGTKYDAAKLNGEISESGNKIRLFSSYAVSEKKSLNYGQAARWLLYINSYDDTSAKPSKEGKEIAKKNGVKMESTGVGWLGKLGLIITKGTNLFETLMLNFILVQVHRDGNIPRSENPVWEKEIFPTQERRKINVPDNLSELYTLQSRRVLLKKKNKRVVGFLLLGGDYFEREEALLEPMTVWKRNKSKAVEVDVPRRHNKSKQLWREFSSIYLGKSCREPGVIMWNKVLIEKGYIPNYVQVMTEIASVQYGDKDFFINHIYSDILSLQRSIIADIGRKWQIYIKDQIEKCDELAKEIGNLARKIFIASGGDVENTSDIISETKQQLYYRVDVPFRNWISSIDTRDINHEEEQKLKWKSVAKKIGYQYANELVMKASPDAFVGKSVTIIINGKEKKKHYSVPAALNEFQIAINKIYPDIGGE